MAKAHTKKTVRKARTTAKELRLPVSPAVREFLRGYRKHCAGSAAESDAGCAYVQAALTRLIGKDRENPRPFRSVDDIVLLAVISWHASDDGCYALAVNVQRALGIDLSKDDLGLGGKL